MLFPEAKASSLFPEAKARVYGKEELWGQNKRHMCRSMKVGKTRAGSRVGMLGSEFGKMGWRAGWGREGKRRPGHIWERLCATLGIESSLCE